MLPVQKPEELVQLKFTGNDMGSVSAFGGDQSLYFSNPMYRDLRSKNAVFSDMLADTETSVGLVWKNKSEVADAELVTGN